MLLKRFKYLLGIHSYYFVVLGMFHCLGTNTLFAQSSAPQESFQHEPTLTTVHWKLDLSLSSAGLGLGIGVRLNELPWILRAKYSYLAGGMDFNFPIVLDSTRKPSLHIHTQARMSHFSLLADYLLLPNENLKITFGAAYHPHKTLRFEGTLRNFTYNKVVYIPTELGKVDATFTNSKFSPYFGLGFGRTMLQKHIRVSAELGFYYLMNWRLKEFKITDGIIVNVWDKKTGDKDLLNAINAYDIHKMLPNLNLMISYQF